MVTETTASRDRTAVVLNPYDYEFHEDPYPIYRRLRDEAPLYHNEELNFWALSRHSDVLQGFRNSISFSNSLGVSLDPVSRTTEAYRVMSFLAMDDPGHLRLRTLVSKGFTPRRIRELEPRVTELAVQHLDTALQSPSFDYIGEFAGKLPMDVISELMGVPEPDRARIRELADGVVHRDEGIADVPRLAMQASADLMAYYADMVSERRKTAQNDLTSALLDAEIDGDRLSDQEIMAFLFLMVVAGNETTTKLLANAAYWGHKNPDQMAPIYEDHSRIPLWVEETLRYDTSSQILARNVVEDITMYGAAIPAGDVLLLLPGSANRDERVFEDADQYCIGREIGSKLVSFGSGAHFCLGAHLARMEARVALTELFKRIRSYEVDEDAAVRVHSSNVRGFAHLPMTVKAA
ncbi:MAG TPA: cytochrome P450 [Mycobacterium sp.]|nr:cytochrome P450 [Mycobacterium sp.]